MLVQQHVKSVTVWFSFNISKKNCCMFSYGSLVSCCGIECFLFDLMNNLTVIKGQFFLGWISSKLGLMFLLKDTMQ